jgi:hypothetical protein
VNFALRAGVANRLRLINITPGLPALTFVLIDGFNTVTWTPVAKTVPNCHLLQGCVVKRDNLLRLAKRTTSKSHPR